MEFTKDLEQLFDANKTIDAVEKGALAVLSYVQPKEVSNTLSTLTVDYTTFVRANIEAFKGITAIAKTQTEEFTKQFAKKSK
jgi:hypothetical protein